MYLIQHIRAPNDRNGNPRRCFILYHVREDETQDGNAYPTIRILAVEEEGYAGIPDEWRGYGRLPAINVSVSEYRRLLGNTMEVVRQEAEQALKRVKAVEI